jgi:bacillithiol biosynthesis deacetylase BshB1
MKIDVLVFAAHPDDVELAMGGTIARLTGGNKKVGIIDFTEAEMSTRGTIESRQDEAKAAANILEVSFRKNLEIPDGNIELNDENLKKVVTSLRKYKPHILFAPFFNDRHPDHVDTCNLVKRAVFVSGLFKYETKFEGSLQEPFRPAKLFHYMQTYTFNPTFIIDISEHFVLKMKSIKAFKSQFHNPGSKAPDTFISRPEFLEYVEARAKFYGFQIGKKYGEPFYCEEEIELDLLQFISA